MPLSAVLNTFAGSSLDRASERRTDEVWLAARLADPATRTIALWNGDVLVTGEGDRTHIVHAPITLARAAAPGDEALLFLGLDEAGALFAVDLEGEADPSAGSFAGLGAFAGLRDLASRLDGPTAAIAAQAKGVFEWRRKHRFCSNCGSASRPTEGGWKRVCLVCRTEHFPRTDPVVIMLAVTGERCLVGHNVRFPPTRFSALAGFVEPGETLEEACARELHEEAGLVATSVAYHSSQPWPFPSSLMMGLIAQVEGEGLPDQTELDEVRWFTRDEARAFLAGEMADASPPPPFTIAHQLIKSWVAD